MSAPEAAASADDHDRFDDAASLEAGRLLFAQPCTFMLGVADLRQLPLATVPEVAFAGRSNVGKSSLINALLGRRDLARTSNTPGRTQEINLFDLGGRLVLVDLPGYGFAKAPKGEIKRWTDLVFAYLRGRPNLGRVCLLIDARRGLMPVDTEVMDLLAKAAVPFGITLTKADLLKRGELEEVEAQLQARLARQAAALPYLITTSSRERSGLDHLRASLARLAADEQPKRSCRPVSDPALAPETHNTVRTLIEALPFMRRYQGALMVIKYGGHAMGDDEAARDFARDVVLLKQVGIDPVVVHGGGPQIKIMLDRLKISSSFVDGLRVTDAATVEVVEMVLAGKINKEIVTAIQAAGGKAVGISGKDGRLIEATKLTRTKRDPESHIEEIVDLGFVGEPANIDTSLLDVFRGSDVIPVIAPIGAGAAGETYNINADTAAGAIAGALKARKLLMLTDVRGVLDAERRFVTTLTDSQAKAWIRDGTISGGMIPKIETCLAAVAQGVQAAVVLDGRVPHAILLEIFTEGGFGTQILHSEG